MLQIIVQYATIFFLFKKRLPVSEDRKWENNYRKKKMFHISLPRFLLYQFFLSCPLLGQEHFCLVRFNNILFKHSHCDFVHYEMEDNYKRKSRKEPEVFICSYFP